MSRVIIAKTPLAWHKKRFSRKYCIVLSITKHSHLNEIFGISTSGFRFQSLRVVPFAGIFYLLRSTTSIGHFKAFRDILLKEWPRRLSRPYHFIKSNSIQIRLFDVACGSLWPGYASCLKWNVSRVTVCAEKKDHHKCFLKSTTVILPDYLRIFRTEDTNYSKGGIICFGSQSLAWLLKNVESIAET